MCQCPLFPIRATLFLNFFIFFPPATLKCIFQHGSRPSFHKQQAQCASAVCREAVPLALRRLHLSAGIFSSHLFPPLFFLKKEEMPFDFSTVGSCRDFITPILASASGVSLLTNPCPHRSDAPYESDAISSSVTPIQRASKRGFIP